MSTLQRGQKKKKMELSVKMAAEISFDGRKDNAGARKLAIPGPVRRM